MWTAARDWERRCVAAEAAVDSLRAQHANQMDALAAAHFDQLRRARCVASENLMAVAREAAGGLKDAMTGALPGLVGEVLSRIAREKAAEEIGGAGDIIMDGDDDHDRDNNDRGV